MAVTVSVLSALCKVGSCAALHPFAPGGEVETKLAAALISTAIIVPAAFFARSAQAEAPTGKAAAIVGRVGLSALFLFGFLCTRGVEILYLLGPDAPLNRESFSEGYFAVSALHCGLAAFSVLWLVLVLLRTAKRGAPRKPSKFLNGAVRFLYLVTGAWLLMVATYYLF